MIASDSVLCNLSELRTEFSKRLFNDSLEGDIRLLVTIDGRIIALGQARLWPSAVVMVVKLSLVATWWLETESRISNTAYSTYTHFLLDKK
jgi:hypothetical protein